MLAIIGTRTRTRTWTTAPRMVNARVGVLEYLIEFIMKRNRILALGGFIIKVIHSGNMTTSSQPFYSSQLHHQLSLNDDCNEMKTLLQLNLLELLTNKREFVLLTRWD